MTKDFGSTKAQSGSPKRCTSLWRRTWHWVEKRFPPARFRHRIQGPCGLQPHRPNIPNQAVARASLHTPRRRLPVGRQQRCVRRLWTMLLTLHRRLEMHSLVVRRKYLPSQVWSAWQPLVCSRGGVRKARDSINARNLDVKPATFQKRRLPDFAHWQTVSH